MPNKTENTKQTLPIADPRLAIHQASLFQTLENFFDEGYLSQPFDALDFAAIALLADKSYEYDQRADTLVEYFRIMRFLGSVYEKLKKIETLNIEINGSPAAYSQPKTF